jgi:hypothetical protein
LHDNFQLKLVFDKKNQAIIDYTVGVQQGDNIRGGENSEATLDYFWKIFDLYFEISNFLLDFLTTILMNLYIPKVRNVPKKFG